MNINVNIGEILTKAWKIVWKFKILWVFGILASCAGNRGGNFNNSFNSGGGGGGGGGTGGNNGGEIPEPLRQFANHPLETIQAALAPYLVIIVVVLALLCVLWLLFVFLGMMGKAGLIKGAAKADAGAEKLTFGELWVESLPYFWRMFGLALLVAVPFFILIVVLLVIFFAGLLGVVANSNGSGSGAALTGLFAALAVFVPSICCLSILRIIVGFIVEQSNNAIVLENQSIIESLRTGWNLFKSNFLTIILMAIILGVLSFIVGLVVAIPLVIIWAPAVLAMAAMFAGDPHSTVALAPLAIASLCCLAYLPVLLVLNGIANAYAQSVWTLTYLRMTAPAVPAAPVVAPEPANAS